MAAEVFEFLRTEPQVKALRALCREWSAGATGFWAFDDVLEALGRPGSLCLFAAEREDSAAWQGAALVDVGVDAADLLYIFVRPGARGARLGATLLDAVIRELRERPALTELFLEVREANVRAIQLYEARGMRRIGTRPRYYRNGDDAAVYRLGLREGET
jgi:ribosomal protein S18 acetylase RimI-like enzyme